MESNFYLSTLRKVCCFDGLYWILIRTICYTLLLLLPDHITSTLRHHCVSLAYKVKINFSNNHCFENNYLVQNICNTSDALHEQITLHVTWSSFDKVSWKTSIRFKIDYNNGIPQLFSGSVDLSRQGVFPILYWICLIAWMSWIRLRRLLKVILCFPLSWLCSYCLSSNWWVQNLTEALWF